MKRVLVFLCIPLLSVMAFHGCAGEKETAIENEEELAARVEDWTLTKEFLFDYIEQLPHNQKEKYNTPQGRAQLTEQIMADELYYREALRNNLAEEPEVKELIDKATRNILIAEYYERYIQDRARPGEQELLAYYNEHQDVYTTLPARRAQHIYSVDKQKLEDLKNRFEAGEKFTTLAHKYSEDPITRADGGNLGYFNPGGYIRGVGFAESLNDTIFKMEPRKVYGPIEWVNQKGQTGYSLVLVNEIRPPRLQPFEDVKREISDLLMRDNVERVKSEVIAEIRDNYDWRNYVEESYHKVQRSPAELFEYAQTTSDPYERIRAFEEIVEKFPDDDHAPQALFMVGFVHMEELKDKKSATFNFKKVLREYPDSDVADSAKWMLDNMDKPMPEFETIEELNKRVSDG